MPVIAVFGGGSFKDDSLEYNFGFEVGKLLAENNFDIATGGYYGVMEAVLKGASNKNIRRIGITTDFYKDKQPNKYINEEIRSDSYIERLRKLIEIADAFVVLPGETGTLLELSAVWTFKEKGIIPNKPLVCLGDQWNEVIQTMTFYSENLLDRSELIAYAESPEDVVSYIVNSFEN